MNEREYRKLSAQIEQRYREDIAALDRIWQLAKPSANGTSRAVKGTRGVVQDGVRAAIGEINGKFTLRDVEHWIRANKPDLHDTARTTISGTLKRLVGKEIEVLEAGKGKRATVYQKRS